MAKKKVPQKKKGNGAVKARGARKQTKKQIATVMDSGPLRKKLPKRPTTRPLPGMEGLAAVPSLDGICSSLADIRFQLNDLRGQEKGQLVNALRELRKVNRTMYKSHGIELVRVPGEEKVRARLVAGEGASDVEPTDDGDDLDNGADNASPGDEMPF